MTETVYLAVNGGLMRGMDANERLIAVNATFVQEATTDPIYRLFTIDDRYPAMLRVSEGGNAIAVEIWAIPQEGLAEVLIGEPPGLSIGKVRLADGKEVLGVLGEAIMCTQEREITQYGGWRKYLAHVGV
ncbi:glutamyl-tRNA amidotransferase [Aphanothece hegewaldii CCALA 016]|uniref:Glutamyl-tRNA amidotransferase n=1 Tax=Aphanothece hegewaldii CCALA 016 TaxID=2107694 RepID=A0A2T1LWR1_9CHRO|nr:gamma-glutamylcyclotransferase [Aphanothece hegewaldii]PSF36596.1 glutamyl-tRNA amidotransferase [Aphanothece hegewaldii CCALA 016]